MRSLWLAILLLAGLAALTACQSTTDLKPAPGADAVPGLDEAARDVVQDVEVVAQTTAWPGLQDIGKQVTPVRVMITNRSGQPLRVRYQEFALIGPEGERYSALPPWQMQGSVTEEVTARVTTTAPDPLFVHRGFHVAPAYRTVYPTWDPWVGPFVHDPWWYETYATYWREIPLPTPGMQARGLPEGVLDPQGHLEGWVYFEHVAADRGPITFRLDLVNADPGRDLGEIRIPLTVQ